MLFLFDRRGLIFCGKRRDSDPAKSGEGWQVPQGGIDQGETLEAAVARELKEEVGAHVAARIIAAAPKPMFYDFPDFLGSRKAFNGKYRGQMQHAFLLFYSGDGGDIDISHSADGEPPEFSAYDWKTPEQIRSLIVVFKRPLYDHALDYFEPMIAEYNAR